MRASPPSRSAQSAPPPSPALRQRDHGEPCRLREGPKTLTACAACRRYMALRGALAHVRSVLETELNPGDGQPPLFSLRKRARSAVETFTVNPLLWALDYLAIATAELANIAERRIEQLVNPSLSGLPAFLTPHPGLNSGLMTTQVTAAALINENKVLCHPASVDSIPSSANREDHVSMGMTSANKAMQVIENVGRVLGIELMTACQALESHQPLRASRAVQTVYEMVRTVIEPLGQDRVLADDLEAIHELLRTGRVRQAAETVAPGTAAAPTTGRSPAAPAPRRPPHTAHPLPPAAQVALCAATSLVLRIAPGVSPGAMQGFLVVDPAVMSSSASRYPKTLSGRIAP